MPARLSLGTGALRLALKGHPDFPMALDMVKSIPGRKFDGETKDWCFPEDPLIAERLLATIKPEPSHELLAWLKKAKKELQNELVSPVPNDADLLIPWATEHMPWQDERINGLFAFQRGLTYFLSVHKHALNASDMGTGKTGVAISAVTESLLRCCYEAGSLIQMGRAESGRTSEALSSLLETLQRQAEWPDSGSQVEALLGLWNYVSSADYGLGSRPRGEIVFARTMDEESGPIGLQFSRRGNFGRDFEVRGTLPELSPFAALALGPKLIVCPSTVKGVWRREIHAWLGPEHPLVVVDGSTAKKRTQQIAEGVSNNAWVIVNWEQLRVKKEKKKTKTKIYDPMTGEVLRIAERTKEVEVMREPLLESTPWLAVIADEAHRAKNRKSLQTKGLLRTSAPIQIAASGTPIMNTPDELWPILKWLFPKEYTSYWRFFDQYVDYYEGNFGKIITGVKNADALRFELKNVLARRTKDEVLDLPEKVRQYVPVTMGPKQKKLYQEAEKQLWFEVEQDIKAGDQSAIAFARAMMENPNAVYEVANGAARLVRLRQILCSPALLGGEDESAKMDAVVDSILDAQKQVVVWTEFVPATHLMVKRLEKHGLRAVAFTGELTSQERTEIEDKFQAGEIDVIIGTIPAMKEGITLTASNQSEWLERAYTPAVNEQGEDRQHRIGQTEPVLVKIYEVEGTIDTSSVAVRNAIKSLIVEAVVKKDNVDEIRPAPQELQV